MKKLTLPVLFALFVLFINSCTTSQPQEASSISKEQLQAAQNRWPDIENATLLQGQTIYVTKCGTCHSLKKIEGQNEAYWEHYIGTMAPKARLSDADKDTMRKYILSLVDSGK